MTLMRIIGDACDEMGLDRPTGVIGNQNPQVRQLFALLRRLCNDLVAQYDWQFLVEKGVIQTRSFKRMATMTKGSNTIHFTTGAPSGLNSDYSVSGDGLLKGSLIVSTQGQGSANLNYPAQKTGESEVTVYKYRFDLPDGYDRMIDNTAWDKSTSIPMYGAVTSSGWQSLTNSITDLGINLKYRLRNGKIEITPSQADGKTIVYEYINKNYVISGSQRTDTFQTDSDNTVFDRSLLTLGLILLFRQSNGFDAIFEADTFRQKLELLKSDDSPSPILSISRVPRGFGIGQRNIKDGNWNV